ncbi:hypothetical protein BDV97DRAFT_203833 [Delphinella strobiligena]|nr:hypothetical protein BDV97DRAFT_203833 [Delphinella strobiligena]
MYYTAHRTSNEVHISLATSGFEPTRPDPCAPPRRHTHRIEATKRDRRVQTIYFKPESLARESVILLGPARTTSRTPGSSPDTSGILELPQYRAEPSNAKYDASMSQCSLPCPSQEEMDFLVDQLTMANFIPNQFEGNDTDSSYSDYSDSDRTDSPTLPSTTHTGSNHNRYSPLTIPSLTSASSRSSVASLPGATLTNYTGTLEDIKRLSEHSQRSHRAGKRHCRVDSGIHTSPALALPRLFTCLALTDPKVTGQPIRFSSSTYEPGTNTLKVGSCTFLNLPYGLSTECGLRIEPRPGLKLSARYKDIDDPRNQQIRLQIVQGVVQASTGRRAFLLCAETDVTEGFTPCVRAELTASVQQESHDDFLEKSEQAIPPRKPTPFPHTTPSHPPIPSNLEGDTLIATDLNHVAELLSSATYQPPIGSINYGKLRRNHLRKKPARSPLSPTNDNDADADIWLNIAKSLSTSTPSTTHLPTSNPKTPGPPSPALQDLLSLLDEIELLHRNFFIIRMSSTRSAKPTRFSIPWLSSKLFQLFFALHADDDDGATRSTRGNEFLGVFKDAMAMQLSEGISEGLRYQVSARPFFKRVGLPESVSCLRQLGLSESSPGSRSSRERSAEMGVYAVPMFDDCVGVNEEIARCWICFLVDQEIEGVWN